ncbi:vacuolar protein sorting-associated protein [Candidatus Brocadia sinica JPN1]|uniref:Vacuolar protein sorting-associated protein n=1 Tax=Candidatus Brocadia sinica JPN1 TaxID=1197129 RepID=A0ABQ0K013_9BACT|nr:vacuolar protein sorting-associated protein [Candidatus Brocadia sinica JPN1]
MVLFQKHVASLHAFIADENICIPLNQPAYGTVVSSAKGTTLFTFRGLFSHMIRTSKISRNS